MGRKGDRKRLRQEPITRTNNMSNVKFILTAEQKKMLMERFKFSVMKLIKEKNDITKKNEIELSNEEMDKALDSVWLQVINEIKQQL